MTREIGFEHIVHRPASVLTTGTFDGVHLGHRAVLRYLKGRAKARGAAATVVTFDPHPRTVIEGTPLPLLTTIGERADLLEAAGLDRFVVLPFTRALAAVEAEDWVRDVLHGQIGMDEIVIGYDHRFGRARKGDRALLEAMSTMLDFDVDIIAEESVGETVVSSTQIRDTLLTSGDVAQAARWLGRRYLLTGTVVRGDQRGRNLGFPTANIVADDPHKLIPCDGVYAVLVYLGRQSFPAMLNIGVRPTVTAGAQRVIEAHLLGFEGDLYGKTVSLAFAERLRDERRFGSVDELVEQLNTDRARCEAFFRSVS